MQHLSTAGLRLHHVHSVPSHEAHQEDILRSHWGALHLEVFERTSHCTSHPPSGTPTAKCPLATCPSHQGLSNQLVSCSLVQHWFKKQFEKQWQNSMPIQDKPKNMTRKFPRRIAASMHGHMHGGHISGSCFFMRVIYLMVALRTHSFQCCHFQPFLKESFQLGQLFLQIFFQYLWVLLEGQCPSNLLTTGLVIRRQSSGGT